MPTNGVSIKPLKAKVLAGEQKATESHKGLKGRGKWTLNKLEPAVRALNTESTEGVVGGP